jgi:hypothetical protein
VARPAKGTRGYLEALARERAARKARADQASAAGLPRSVAYGKARKVGVDKPRGQRVETFLQERREREISRRPEGRWGAHTDFTRYPGGTVLDTSTKRDAMRFLRQAAAEGRQVFIVGTRKDGKGAPVGKGFKGEPIDAGLYLQHIWDDYGGDIWDAIDGDSEYGGTAPVVRVSIQVVGGAFI